MESTKNNYGVNSTLQELEGDFYMYKIFIKPISCDIGDVLAQDVVNENGIALLTENTMINEYIKNKLIELKIPSICIYRPTELELKQSSKGKDTFNEVTKTYKSAILDLKNIVNELCVCGSVDYKKIIDISNSIVGTINESGYIIKCLSEIKDFDEYTYSHSVNVALYSMLIAKWIELPEHEICEVTQSGLLHDIGKTKVPDEILNKRGKLTPDEFEVIKEHCDFGYDCIKYDTDINENIKMAVLSHHEKIDGSGYPRGLSGDSISLFAKIISVADVYDAMTQNRVYKKKSSPFDAFKMFSTEGLSKFDNTIIYTFLKNISTFYIGTTVKLNTGDVGEVVYIPPQDIIYPIVKVNLDYIDFSREHSLKVLNLI
jgi:putative nucleotidyltransferase with HDIG domain